MYGQQNVTFKYIIFYVEHTVLFLAYLCLEKSDLYVTDTVLAEIATNRTRIRFMSASN
jgi:hypothetical protein